MICIFSDNFLFFNFFQRLPDEDDEEGDTNYRREKIKSEPKPENQKTESTSNI